MVVRGKASAGYRLGAAVVGGFILGIPVFPALAQTIGAQSGGAQTSPVQMAQVSPATRSYGFDLPAQPLTTALTAFSRITGLQTVTTGTSLEGKRASAVRGNLTADEALRQLLSGSGIMHRRVDANTVTLLDAPQGSMGGVVLDALTVSGEKTDRSLQETATSVAVFDGKALEQRPGLTSTNDLLSRVPNVVYNGASSQAPTIRGIDGTGPTIGGYAFVAGIRSRVNLQVDGRPTSFNELVYGDNSLWDVEQVEVLRGPQSTMQGRNAIAGAITVKTKDPTWDWQSGGRVMAGNYDTRQAAAYVSGPIIDDQLAFRLAADRQTSESFTKGVQNYPGVANPNEFESDTMRGKFLLQPRQWDGFSTLFTANYSKVTSPQSEMVRWPEAGLVSGFPTNTPVFEPRTVSGIAETSWILSDSYTVENTFSYTDLAVRRRASVGNGYVEIDGYEALAEPRLRFTGMDGRLKGLGGLHAFHASQDELFEFFGDHVFKDMTTTYATFGEATYTVVPDVDVTIGGRLERENRRRQLVSGPFFAPVNLDETVDVFLPKIGTAWRVDKTWTLGATVARGYNGGGAGVTFGTAQLYQFKPEYVWNYEAYTRHELMGGRLQLTGNIFYADYKNMQLAYNPNGTLNDSIVLNAPKSHTYGSEIGARWLAMPGLTLFGNLGLLKTEIDEMTFYAGKELANAPAFTADIGFSYEFGNGFDVGADARYSEAYYSDIDNRPRAKVDPYLVANLKAGYQIVPNARIFSYVNNVFDTRAETMISSDYASADIVRPRTIGIGMDVKF
jgi:iron complex outermembrane receptor protein